MSHIKKVCETLATYHEGNVYIDFYRIRDTYRMWYMRTGEEPCRYEFESYEEGRKQFAEFTYRALYDLETRVPGTEAPSQERMDEISNEMEREAMAQEGDV